PLTTDDTIMDAMDWQDLQSYGQTCRHLYNKKTRYLVRRFSVYTVFMRSFFNSSEWTRFQIFQATSGILISGSIALQFFNREYIPTSPLDLFLEKTYVEGFLKWLREIGYTDICAPTVIDFTPDDPEQWPQVGDLDFHVLSRVSNSRKIRVFVANGPPVAMILSFQNTCFMNIIAYDCAYSLFPVATFLRKEAYESGFLTPLHRCFPVDYDLSGWTLRFAADDDDDRHASIRLINRYIGDEHCWTMKLIPAMELDPLVTSIYCITNHVWKVGVSRNFRRLSMVYDIFKSHFLRHSYVVYGHHLQQHAMHDIYLVNDDLPIFQDPLRKVLWESR
ncbi:hypothetical protein BDN70DRAFT_821201, partial [Pholiota conissans]